MESPTTLLEALEKRANSAPERVAYRFLREGEVEHDSITFGELRRRARSAAARLAARRGDAREDAAILLYPQGIEFIVAFFGCMYAGVMAVPASISNRKRGADILARIAQDAGARWILSTGTQLEQLIRDSAGESPIAGLACIDLEQGNDRTASLPALRIDPHAVAMLQYTSGSTGTPSGVAITHANLVNNQQQMQRSFEHDDETVIVSWLPMFHDMGLGTVLMTIWTGRPCVFMAPSAFVQNPRRWLAAISHYRGTTSLAPDFAYDLCVRRVSPKEREGLDLSSWRVAVNGSEPVRSATIERFAEAFGPCGFRRESMVPAYGLAEATLYVASDEARNLPLSKRFSKASLEQGDAVLAEPGVEASVLVGCGRTRLGTQLLIVDPETAEECQPGKIGEIWISGESVGAGYWKKELETEYTFRATAADGRGPFLRTGDLAFISDGHVFVAGRYKDLIIIRGRNHSPQDIEDSVSTCHPALVPRGCAAFSVDTAEGEQLVIVQEVARTALRTLDALAVMRAIRSIVSDNHALHTHAIVLLKPSSLPRTTSGKVKRKACRQAFLTGTLPAVSSWGAEAHSDSARGLSAEQREMSVRADRVIEWLRRYSKELLASYPADGRRGLSPELAGILAKQGLLGMQVEPKFGGLGIGHSDTARVVEQLAAMDFSLALLIGANTYLNTRPIAKYAGSPDKARYLASLVQGETFAAQAFGDRDSGTTSAPGQLELSGEEPWRLSGTCEFSGTSPQPDWFNVLATHDEPPGSSTFVVSKHATGLEIVHSDEASDVLGFSHGSVRFTGTPVRREDLLGSFGAGGEIAAEAHAHMRLAVGAACIGAMKRCAQMVSRDGPYRPALNGKATPNPVILSRLGSAAARVTALECLVHAIARASDAGRAVPAEAFAACKLLGPEMLLRSIDDLMLVGLKGGIDESNQVLRTYREASSLRNLGGAPEALAEVTGAAIMAEDAPLRLLLSDVLGAPTVVTWVDPVLDAVRHRMRNLKGALARRAERWGHTRAGELASWLALLAAVEASLNAARTPDLVHAHRWTQAQLEHAVSAVQMGTPSETATLDADDIAYTFAAYARTIGNIAPERRRLSGAAARPEPVQQQVKFGGSSDGSPSSAANDYEAAKRELRSWIISWLANTLRIPVAKVEAGRSFADHGLDSVSSVELATDLSAKLGREIDATVVWTFATIDALAEHLVTESPSEAVVQQAPPQPRSVAPGPRSSETQLEDELAKLEHELRSRS